MNTRLAVSAIVILGIVVAGTALSMMLRPSVDQALENAANLNHRAWIFRLVPDARVIESIEKNDGIEFTRVTRDDGRTAIIGRMINPDGYNGNIDLAVAVDDSARVQAIVVIEHRETRGFGDFVDDDKHPWLSAFTGRSLANPPLESWRLRSEGGGIDGISGATITANAVVDGTRDIMQKLNAQQQTQ